MSAPQAPPLKDLVDGRESRIGHKENQRIDVLSTLKIYKKSFLYGNRIHYSLSLSRPLISMKEILECGGKKRISGLVYLAGSRSNNLIRTM